MKAWIKRNLAVLIFMCIGYSVILTQIFRGSLRFDFDSIGAVTLFGIMNLYQAIPIYAESRIPEGLLELCDE